jgi:hypothetical protein
MHGASTQETAERQNECLTLADYEPSATGRSNTFQDMGHWAAERAFRAIIDLVQFADECVAKSAVVQSVRLC